MGEITIYFAGICTHLRNVIDGVPHRVLLVYEPEVLTINGYDITSHKPSLLSTAGILPETSLRTIFRIQNAVGGPPAYGPDYDRSVFSLEAVAGQPLTLNRAVVEGKQSPASVYFDLHHGNFSAAVVPRTAIGVRVVVSTDGDPILTMTSMDVADPASVTLPSGTRLIIRNEALAPADHQDADFLLHYRACTEIPEGDAFPTKSDTTGLPDVPLLDGELGPGCSNSNYP